MTIYFVVVIITGGWVIGGFLEGSLSGQDFFIGLLSLVMLYVHIAKVRRDLKWAKRRSEVDKLVMKRDITEQNTQLAREIVIDLSGVNPKTLSLFLLKMNDPFLGYFIAHLLGASFSGDDLRIIWNSVPLTRREFVFSYTEKINQKAAEALMSEKNKEGERNVRDIENSKIPKILTLLVVVLVAFIFLIFRYFGFWPTVWTVMFIFIKLFFLFLFLVFKEKWKREKFEIIKIAIHGQMQSQDFLDAWEVFVRSVGANTKVFPRRFLSLSNMELGYFMAHLSKNNAITQDRFCELISRFDGKRRLEIIRHAKERSAGVNYLVQN